MCVHLLIISNIRHAWVMIYSSSRSYATEGNHLSYYNAKPIHLDLRPSALLVWVISLACMLFCFVLLLLPIHTGFKLVLMAVIVASSVYFMRHHARLSLMKSIVSLNVNIETGLQLNFIDGTRREAQVLGHSFVAPYLTVLNMRTLDDGKCISLILLPDNTEPDSFRHLRVWLRWGREAIPDAADLS